METRITVTTHKPRRATLNRSIFHNLYKDSAGKTWIERTHIFTKKKSAVSGHVFSEIVLDIEKYLLLL